jgi:tetratricopeptide (TPR) repeat protein
VGAVWFAAGVAPLAALLPDWNAWRAWTPSVGFAVAAGAALGAVSPWLAGALVAIKLVALLASPLAPATISATPPVNGSHVSFSQLVRLQRMVDATRRELRARAPHLPRGAHLAYWQLPLLTEFAFQGSRAPRVWYDDSTIVWTRFGAAEGLTRHIDLCIEYRFDDPQFVAVIPGASIREFQRGSALASEERYAAVDSVLAIAESLAGYDRGPYYASIVRNRGFAAYNRRDYDTAARYARLAMERGPQTADTWALVALLAIKRNDRGTAEAAVRRAFELEPQNDLVLDIAKDLGLTPAR